VLGAIPDGAAARGDARRRVGRTLARALARALDVCDDHVRPPQRRAAAFAALDVATHAYVRRCRAEGDGASDVLARLSDATRAAAPRSLRPAAARELRIGVFYAFLHAYYRLDLPPRPAKTNAPSSPHVAPGSARRRAVSLASRSTQRPGAAGLLGCALVAVLAATHADAQPPDPAPAPITVPEPATPTLLAIGAGALAAAGTYRWRRGRSRGRSGNPEAARSP
jgi:hypothetical protein